MIRRMIALLVSGFALVTLASTPASGREPAATPLQLIVLGDYDPAGNEGAPGVASGGVPSDPSGGVPSDPLSDLADRTGGTVLPLPSTSPSESAKALLDAILGPRVKPSAWAAGPYVTVLGEPIELDGSGSYDPDGGRIVSYEWDLDGDGDFDVSTSKSTYMHTFAGPIDGTIRLRVTDDEGTTAVATAFAHASSDGDEVPPRADNCPDLTNHGQSGWDGDGIGDVCDPTPFG